LPIHCLNYLQSEPMSKIPGKRTLIAANVQNSQKGDIGRSQCLQIRKNRHWSQSMSENGEKRTLVTINVQNSQKDDIGRDQCLKLEINGH
jgi:hypothetical protein